MANLSTWASIAIVDLLGEITLDSAIAWIESNAVLIGGVIAALVVLLLLRRLLAGGEKRPEPAPTTQTLTLAELGERGVPSTGPRIIFRNVPVRLAALVIAPMGRTGPIPDVGELPAMVDLMLPGLASIVAAHRPTVQGWGSQSSVPGFTSAFFGQASLPGKLIGIGTPWTAVAGTYRYGGARFAIGVILRADAPNNIGEIIINDEAEWRTNFVVGSG